MPIPPSWPVEKFRGEPTQSYIAVCFNVKRTIIDSTSNFFCEDFQLWLQGINTTMLVELQRT